jgi:triphosphoribosyl-dephospho-CoA synthase
MTARLHAHPDADALANAFRAACALDVLAFKPGNVSIHSPGHGMRAEDFIDSAAAAAPHLVDPALALGERIYRAVEATRRAAGCNTNLGIVLLAAPLLHAAQQRTGDETLAGGVQRSLGGFDLEQTDWVYRAIRLASPGGLGKSPRHDVQRAPGAPLMTAMREASRRDCIARQYATGFADLLDAGAATLARARERWDDDARTLTELFLDFLANRADSHIVRKHGAAAAEGVRQRARQCLDELTAGGAWDAAQGTLDDMDRTLKSAGINPGTSADLCVGTWLADRLGAPAFEAIPFSATHGLPAKHSAPTAVPIRPSQR